MNAPARPPPAEPEDGARRRVLSWLTVVGGAVAAALVAVPSGLFLLGLRRAPQVWRAVGRLESFQLGSTTEVSFADPSPLPWSGVSAQTAAWLRRAADGELTAFSIHCTHLGCPVRWLGDAELFMCPCHGGVFYADGRVASGPPPRPLVRYPVRVRDGLVEILTSPVPIA